MREAEWHLPLDEHSVRSPAVAVVVAISFQTKSDLLLQPPIGGFMETKGALRRPYGYYVEIPRIYTDAELYSK